MFLSGIVLAIGLVFLGWILFPTEKAAGMLAAIAILILYGLVGWIVPGKIEGPHPIILSNGTRFGLIAGFIFAGEIILEYVLLPKDNTVYGVIEFAGVFVLYFLAGLSTTVQTNSLRKGSASAVWAAIISILMWVIVLLGMFYLFRGTAQQTQVFQAEGNYADFARSGANDFNTFVMEDFMGAVFYHALLGPISALILGTLGGLTGKGMTKILSYKKTLQNKV